MKRPGLPAAPVHRPRQKALPLSDRAQAVAPGADARQQPPAATAPAAAVTPVPAPVPQPVARPAAGVQDALQAIAAYLVLYPGAADNAEGIAQWWLPALHTQQPLAHVQAALQLLQQQGLVVARPLPDGHLVYALAPGDVDAG